MQIRLLSFSGICATSWQHGDLFNQCNQFMDPLRFTFQGKCCGTFWSTRGRCRGSSVIKCDPLIQKKHLCRVSKRLRSTCKSLFPEADFWFIWAWIYPDGGSGSSHWERTSKGAKVANMINPEGDFMAPTIRSLLAVWSCSLCCLLWRLPSCSPTWGSCSAAASWTLCPRKWAHIFLYFPQASFGVYALVPNRTQRRRRPRGFLLENLVSRRGSGETYIF